ncbi:MULTISPECIES: hypothetical protein [unclassified Delftia]|uniref:hypothetical protein n=1 Tax=unclassified Delftia TaxID=2613839 RepID=UPI001900292F|nr:MULTISPECIES: hypothetical protein [unclassified Delftia]MBK0115441.1 hypothetical protein [Delftia sp. S65]MBK0121701.1 hypothetical protein [Delftia sp. S67]MBK0133728.1 hypothetical protein [Delftia sp. S66]
MAYYDLNRRFVERKSYDQDELIAPQLDGKLVGWTKVLENRSSVIVAAANFGKTTEMRHQAAQLRANGETAVFIALRQLADRGSLEKALEGDDRDTYRAWKAAPVGRITVFVDSLDEAAAAGKDESISHLVGDVADEMKWPNEHVRWVISTRPAVLTSRVFEKLSSLLSKPAPKLIGGSGGVSGLGNSDGVVSVAVDAEKRTPLRLFSMAHLEYDQAAVYLAGRYPALNAKQLIEIASERGLPGFIRSPGGLDILARIDMVANPPASLTDVFERVVNAIGTLHGADHRLVDAGNPEPTFLTAAAQRLASASVVCQLLNIEMPEATLAIPESALSARLIASPLLHEAGIKALLNSQLFIDAGYHQVKVYPDELLPFLAAKRLAGLVASPDQAERLLENFTWTATSGERGVQRAFLPMLGWLATLNAHCREVIVEKDPQALAFFGDLRNPAVPLKAAQDALTESIKRLVEQGDHIGRNMFRLTSENFWQAGPDRLAGTISSLYDQYQDNYWARQALLDIATACKIEPLRAKLLKRHGSKFARVLSDSSDVGYFLALGWHADLAALADAAMASTDVREGVVSRLIRELGWRYFSPRDVAVMVDNQFLAGPRGFQISYSIEKGSLLTDATDGQLYELARGLAVRMAKREVKHKQNREDQQYLDLIAKVLEALVVRTDGSQAAKVARLCLIVNRVIYDSYEQSSAIEELRSAVEANATVRLALLRATVQRRLNDDDLLHAVVGFRRPSSYTPEDVVQVNDVQLTRVYADWQAQCAQAIAQQPLPKPAKPKSEERTVGAKAKRQLTERLSALAKGTDTLALEWIARWLLQTNRTSRYGEVDFKAFEQAAGTKIAAATRQGMSRLWRDKTPTFKESEPNSTFHISAAGLQGLHLELADGTTLPALTDPEVRRALRYGLLEINGYPKWFWPLVEKYPTVSVSELVSIAGEAAKGATSREHAEDLLASVSNAPVPVQEALAGLAWTYLVNVNPSHDYVLNRLLKAALSVPGKVPQNDFERLALQKMKAAYCSPLADPVDEALRAQREHAFTWATRWFIHSPLRWRNAINAWGPSDPLAVKTFIFDLAAAFGRDHENIAGRIATESDHGILALEDLYLWTRWAVDPKDDVERPEGISYTPGDRDNAERFRGGIISGIAAATSQAAYSALERIKQAMPASNFTVEYIKKMQFELRERQFTREPLPQVKYAKFEEDFRGEVTGTTSLAMAVHADLRAVKYDVERGEHSLRSFFSQVDFMRVSKKGTEGEKAGLALEALFQRLLASELNHHARTRYSVTVESQTAEAKRRDILCSKDDWRASIELKMSARWNLTDYVAALEDQLVGQYMRHNKATTGFLVVVLQTKSRQWIDPKTKKKLNFQEVLAILSAKAQELETKDRTRYLRVIGIDATTPDDFRAVTKKSPAKKTIRTKTTQKA